MNPRVLPSRDETEKEKKEGRPVGTVTPSRESDGGKRGHLATRGRLVWHQQNQIMHRPASSSG